MSGASQEAIRIDPDEECPEVNATWGGDIRGKREAGLRIDTPAELLTRKSAVLGDDEEIFARIVLWASGGTTDKVEELEGRWDRFEAQQVLQRMGEPPQNMEPHRSKLVLGLRALILMLVRSLNLHPIMHEMNCRRFRDSESVAECDNPEALRDLFLEYRDMLGRGVAGRLRAIALSAMLLNPIREVEAGGAKEAKDRRTQPGPRKTVQNPVLDRVLACLDETSPDVMDLLGEKG